MMKNVNETFWKGLLFVAIFATGSIGQSAQFSLSLDEAVRLTKQNSEAMKLSYNAIEKTENQYREALGAILPQLSATAQWQKFFQNPVFFTNTFPISQQLQSSITVSQTLWAFGQVSGALRAASAGEKMGQLQKSMTETEVRYITEVSYYTVLLTESQVKVAQQALKNAEENLRILQRKFSGGRPPQGDFLRLKSDISTRIPQLKLAETNYTHAKMTLAQLVGKEDVELKLVTPFRQSFAELSQTPLLEQMQKNQPQLQFLQESVHFASEVSNSKRGANLPVLSAFGTYSYSGGSTGGLTEQNLNGYSFAGLQLTWNMWDGGKSGARYRQAVNDRTAAELQLLQGQKQLTLNLKKSVTSYNNFIASYESAKEAVDLADKSFQISQRRFATGQSSVTEINSSEFALTQARLALSQNIFQIHATLAEINKLIAANNGDKI